MERVGKIMLGLVLTAAGLYLAVCIALFAFQRSLIYFPRPNSSQAGITPMSLETPSGTVSVLTRPCPDHAILGMSSSTAAEILERECPGHVAVLYFGGNAEGVSLDMPDLTGAFPTASLYLLNYPGYGSSPGHPSEQAILAAAFALFDRLHATHTNITVIGRSLGSGVAVQLAAARPVSRLVLVTPFDSFADPAAAAYPYFPVRLLLRDKFDSYRYAPQVTAPTHIIAAADDEIVPRASTERLLTRFKPGVAHYTVLPNADHNSISENPDYYHLLAEP